MQSAGSELPVVDEAVPDNSTPRQKTATQWHAQSFHSQLTHTQGQRQIQSREYYARLVDKLLAEHIEQHAV